MAQVSGIRGRFFSVLLTKAITFYERHQNTINVVISQAAVAALQALIAELPNIVTALNPPGPQ